MAEKKSSIKRLEVAEWHNVNCNQEPGGCLTEYSVNASLALTLVLFPTFSSTDEKTQGAGDEMPTRP